MAIDIEVLVVLSVPTFVVHVEQIFPVWSFDDHFNCGLAPDVFGVTGVNLVPNLYRPEFNFIDPSFVRERSFLPLVELFRVALLFLSLDVHFHRVVD